MIKTLAEDIKEHCNLMIEEAQDRMDEINKDIREALRKQDDYSLDKLYSEFEYHQGKKDSLRVILLVVADHHE